MSWTGAATEATGGEVIAVDGETGKGLARSQAREQSAAHAKTATLLFHSRALSLSRYHAWISENREIQPMYIGGCLCGKVRFEITGAIRNIIYCHCSQCRKAQGSAFATNGIVAADDFRIVSGEGNLTGFRSSPDQTKYFCKTCGSPILSKRDTLPDQVRIRLGTIESDISERPQAHTFVTSKASWEEICGDLPRYNGHEPGR